MTATITATPDLVNWPPRMTLNVSGMTGTALTVVRLDADGTRTTVRSANPTTLSGGGQVVYDYEPHDGESATWIATSNLDATGATVTATMPTSVPRLVHPGIPSLSVPLTVVDMGDHVAEVNQGVHHPLGRATAIVITDSRRHAPTFDLSAYTTGLAAESAMWTILRDTSTLLLQISYNASVGVDRNYYYWVAIGSVTRARLGTDFRTVAGGADFGWTLPCTVASRPSGSLQPQRTWADVAAAYPYNRDLVGAYATWRDVILDHQNTTPNVVIGGGETFTHNADGTVTVTNAVTNPDGTITITTGVDNPDGTVTVPD